MPRKIPLPRGWNRRAKAAILQILAIGDQGRSGALGVYIGPDPQRKTRKVVRGFTSSGPVGSPTAPRSLTPPSGAAPYRPRTPVELLPTHRAASSE